MTLLLERIDTEGLAQLSYLVGDSKAGVAAVIDPRRDVDMHLRLAREREVRITHIIETHIHADFVSGAHELKVRTGAEIIGGNTRDYRFPLRQMAEGEQIALGSVTLSALHTPGHTPEHLSFLVCDITEWTVHELDRHRQDPDLIVLDVRSDEEFAKGAVPGARHIYVPHLAECLDDLDRSKAIATYCGSGYRASIAASVLQKNGFQKLANIPGSWRAWQAARLPVEGQLDDA
jgi:rhodanese-related sulfurtransferase